MHTDRGSETTRRATGQRPEDVVAFRRERRPVGKSVDDRLRHAFVEATANEVADPAARRGTAWSTTASPTIAIRASGLARTSRTHSSVSSAPTGRAPSRPTAGSKAPTSSNTSRRKAMLQPSGFLMRPVVRCPWYEQPTTHRYSSGKPAQVDPPPRPRSRARRRPSSVRLRKASNSAPSQPALGSASSSTNANTSPRAASTPVFRAPERPCGPRFGMTSTVGNCSERRAWSSSLWSMTATT